LSCGVFVARKLDDAVSNRDVQRGRRQALIVVLGQVALGAVVAIACLGVGGSRAGASALFGAGIGIVATSLMAYAMLRHGDGADVQRATWSFFSGWLVKVGFTVALLVVAFRSPQVAAVPLLAGYVATFFGYGFAALRSSGTAAKE
jgi:F0F1-type ATP synthase assembly protein I